MEAYKLLQNICHTLQKNDFYISIKNHVSLSFVYILFIIIVIIIIEKLQSLVYLLLILTYLSQIVLFYTSGISTINHIQPSVVELGRGNVQYYVIIIDVSDDLFAVLQDYK